MNFDIVCNGDIEFRIREVSDLRHVNLAASDFTFDLGNTRLDRRARFGCVGAHLELVHAQVNRTVVLQVLHTADIRAQRDSARTGNVHRARAQRVGMRCGKRTALNAQARHTALITRQRQVTRAHLDQLRANRGYDRLRRRRIRVQNVRICLPSRLCRFTRDLAFEVVIIPQFAEHQHRIASDHVAFARQRADGERVFRLVFARLSGGNRNSRYIQRTAVQFDRRVGGDGFAAHLDRTFVGQCQTLQVRVGEGQFAVIDVRDECFAALRLRDRRLASVDQLHVLKLRFADRKVTIGEISDH
ncbi:hypothetical protein PBR20603_04820 [Pandoraea bronchicola]|uniref:Uncharacterized protein n=1 Tax=Pandoraea bronchicola TaxID=2508287 RepID=A0A5E5BYD4_9BURK|nr:hypothetical protein PBR20603_04820 [Pandoraea bronchicola]